MTAHLYEILHRERLFEVEPGSLSQFDLSRGNKVDRNRVALDRNWTLYCLDHDSRQALFLEMPEGIDLAEAPFSFVTQFDLAKRALLMTFEDMIAVSKAAPVPGEPIFVFSIGRCGSTLVSKIFSNIPNVWSLSEPEAMTSMARGRTLYATDQAADLIRAAMRLSFRPPKGRESDRFVAKFRSQSLLQTDPYVRAFPDAKNLFLYRDYKGWTNSIYRFAQKLVQIPPSDPFEQLRGMWDNLSAGASTDYLIPFLDISDENIAIENMLAATWANAIEHYHRAIKAGTRFDVFSYEQLNNDREASVARLLDICGIEAAHQSQAMLAYEKHSQQGTTVTNEKPTRALSASQNERIRKLLADYPNVDPEDPLVPPPIAKD